MASFVGWSQEAIDLLEKAVARHGGWDRWRRLKSVSFETKAMGGPLPIIKGLGSTFFLPGRAEVFPHQGKAVFHDYPAPKYGVFDKGDVSICTREGQAIRESKDHRRSFDGLKKYRRWDPLDCLYFFGYALSNYMAAPFYLAEQELIGVRRFTYKGRELSGVELRFPQGFPTHSLVQRFFFDESGLLLRHDYTADVVNAFAQGAHFSLDYIEEQGLWFAQERRVMAAPLWHLTPIPVLKGSLRNFKVEHQQ